MNINDNYYKKISYKKNTYQDMSLYLKMYYKYKKVLFISTKSCPILSVTEIVNAISLADCTFKHICVSNNFNYAELTQIYNELDKSNFNLIVGLGAGRCCDVCKYFAYVENMPYIFSPTIPSSLAYFVPYCINPFDSTKNVFAKTPSKIYISEASIRELDKDLYGYCLANFASYLTVLFDFIIIDDVEYRQKIDKIYKIYSRLKNEILQNDSSENNLILMDLFIDLGYELQGVDFEKLSIINMYSLCKKFENNITKFDNKLPIYADILCEIFCNIIDEKIDEKINIFNIINLVEIIKKYKINIKNVKNVKKIAKNCKFLIKNNKFLENQNNFIDVFNKIKNEYKLILNSNFINQNIYKNVNMESCFLAINMLPIVFNSNYVLTSAFLSGRINFA